MSYATVADMQQRYRRSDLNELTAYKNESIEPSDSVLVQALHDASALIDSYISARYMLPLSVVPSTLSQQCCVIAYYFLCDERATEQVTQRYKDAIKWLADVRDGKIPMGTDNHGIAPATEDLVEVKADKPVFSRHQRGFI